MASFIAGNKQNLNEEELMSSYGYLVKDFKLSVYSVYYHVIFLVRRLSIAASINFLNEVPYVQSTLCSLSCCIVLSN